MEKRLVPFSLYLPPDLHRKLKQAAKQRKASQLVRDGIKLILDGGDHYKSGYNKAIKDAAKVVYDCPEGQMVAVKGRDIGTLLRDQIEALEIK